MSFQLVKRVRTVRNRFLQGWTQMDVRNLALKTSYFNLWLKWERARGTQRYVHSKQDTHTKVLARFLDSAREINR